MIQNITTRIVFFLFCALLAGAITMCGDKKEAAKNDTAAKDETENVLSIEEQRALRAEYSIEADENITEENFEKAYEELKKEIEAEK